MTQAIGLSERTQVHMATFLKLSLPQNQTKLFKPSFETAKKMETIFSTYKSDAQAYTLNKTKSTKVSSEFLELLELSKKIYKQTKGYFTIAIGSITKKRYHFGDANEKIPTKKSLNKARTDMNGIYINNDEVSLDKNIDIDFGGIAKGFTVDKIRYLLENENLSQFQIAFSGDIYCKGTCQIAIQSPFVKDEIIKVLHLKDMAVSTSGNYERYIKSKEHNHLINPKTKRSQTEIASMTLYSKEYDNATLDALATALSVMPHAQRMSLLSSLPALSYYFVTTDKKIYKTH